jgi:hypothetical protein
MYEKGVARAKVLGAREGGCAVNPPSSTTENHLHYEIVWIRKDETVRFLQFISQLFLMCAQVPLAALGLCSVVDVTHPS